MVNISSYEIKYLDLHLYFNFTIYTFNFHLNFFTLKTLPVTDHGSNI